MDKPLLSIVIPALNEENNILAAVDAVLKAFDGLMISGEVIVINDGSTDKTQELVKGLMSKEGARISLINHDAPQGIGASFWDGVDKASGEIVSMFPGDNENNPYETLRYLKLLEDVDMVVPFVFNKKARSRFRNILSYVYKLIINLTFNTSFNYTNGTVLYRKCILMDLSYRNRGFFFQTDILIRLARKGYLFAEVPYSLGVREAGKSKAVSFTSFFKVTKGYLKLIKDMYFKREAYLNRYKFNKDSVSAKRYH